MTGFRSGWSELEPPNGGRAAARLHGDGQVSRTFPEEKPMPYRTIVEFEWDESLDREAFAIPWVPRLPDRGPASSRTPEQGCRDR